MKQHSLPGANEPQQIRLTDCVLKLYPGWLGNNISQRLLQHLLTSVHWQQDNISLYGKTHPIPRLQAWYGDAQSHYHYSGIALKPILWSKELAWVKKQLEQQTGYLFNSALCNLYRDGRDSVSWHSDNEPELGADPVIASYNLGATRTFRLRHQHTREVRKLDLPHDTLLIMGKGCQHHWQHQIAKTATPCSQRVNLTFRYVHPR